MVEASALRVGRRVGVLLAVVALVAASLVAVIGASPAGAAGPPDHLTFTQFPSSPKVAGVANAWTLLERPQVTIQDIANATVDTGAAVTASVYLHITPTSINTPAEQGATLSCTTNPVAAVAGVATFNGCHIDRAGTYTLTAEAPTIGLALESGSITIVAAAASKLAFTTQPSDGTKLVDLATQPVVTIEDAFGNPTTAAATNVTLAIQNNAGPGGSLSCSATVINTTAVANFGACDISLEGTGYTLSATSSPVVLTSATSAAFNISNGTAVGLAFITQPTSGPPATAFPLPFRVAFVDSAGRTVTNHAGSTIAVDKAGSSPAGILSGCSYSLIANGVITVSACQLSLPGVFQLVADDLTGPVLPPVTSNPFTVGILHLAFLTQPGNGTAGNQLSSQPVVAVQDASNQTVSSTSAIALNIAPGTGTPGATLTCDANPVAPVSPSDLAVFALCEVDLPGIGYVITATSTALGLSVNSAPFNVIGPAFKLVFTTQPSNGSAGAPFPTQPVVQIQDAVGQLITTDNTTVVTLAKTAATPVSGGPGTLTCPSKTAVAGVAVFAGCSINQAGTGYKLTASSVPVLATATSNAFNISALHRIWGTDAIDTSIAVSVRAFPASDSANAVVLARSDFFSDALAGGPLAAAQGGPLLITPGASQSSVLDPRVLAEIQRLLPTGHTVYILGGTLALASGIDTQLNALGFVAVRVAGANLYSTAVAIADRLGNPATIFEATGLNFPDALSAVPAAIKTSGAILLTAGATQAPETAAYLAAHPPTTRYAIGGPLAAWGADPGATPVYGSDLFGTSAAVAATFFPSPVGFGVATGANYPDALSGGVFMATGGRLGPMLLVNTHVPIPPTIAAYIAALPPMAGYIFGGPLAVGDDVEAAIIALL